MSKRQGTLDSFFSSKKIKNTESNDSEKSGEVELQVDKRNEIGSVGLETMPIPMPMSSNSSTDSNNLKMEISTNQVEVAESVWIDVGVYIERREVLTDVEKHAILKKVFRPDTEFQFPYSLHVKNEKERKCYLRFNHFEQFPWLTYFISLKGLFCKFCFVFAKYGGVHKSTRLSKLVLNPLKKFSKLLGKDGDLSCHESAKFHKEALTFAENFLETFADPQKDIKNIINSSSLDQIQNNRNKIKSIIGTVNFLGRQNIAFRGHRYPKSLIEHSDENEGNLRELIRYRIDTHGDDVILKSLFESASDRQKYISPSIQNEMINCIGEEISSILLKRIITSNFYSVIFGETTDISKCSQMSLVFRYLDNSGVVREDFLNFLDCHHENYDEFTKEPILTGALLGETVVKYLKKVGLDLGKCIGIGTDTCSVMLSDKKGAVSEMRKELKNAIASPCYNHSLNLSISKSSNVQDIRNAVGVIKETIAFFNASAKRNHVLKCRNDAQLTSLCETRWIDRHESILKFKSCFANIISSLELISEWKDNDSSTKARLLIDSMCKTTFIVALCSLSHFLSLTVNLSNILQNKAIDKAKAEMLVNAIVLELTEKRAHSDEEFQHIFDDVEKIHSNLHMPVSIPRLNARQRNRCNVDVNNPRNYYKISIFVPLLDNVLQDLTFRNNSELFKALEINKIIPSLLILENPKNIETVVLVDSLSSKLLNFAKDTQNIDLIKMKVRSEIKLWRQKWTNKTQVPDSAIDALSECDKDIFPNLNLALQYICTLPASVGTAERSFSTLKRLKSWLRATMAQDRLVGLALMNIHREIRVDVDLVLERFIKKGPRKISLLMN